METLSNNSININANETDNDNTIQTYKTHIHQMRLSDKGDLKTIEKLIKKKQLLMKNGQWEKFIKEDDTFDRYDLVVFDDDLFNTLLKFRSEFNIICMCKSKEKRSDNIKKLCDKLNNQELLERLFFAKHSVFKYFQKCLDMLVL
jgi:hypothetical protein